MAKSQNGWGVITRLAYTLRRSLLWAHPLFGAARAGDVWVILNWVAARYVALVEPIDPAQSGGWNPRRIAGSTKWSNHASATAIDLNWRLHPAGQGSTKGFTAAQVAAIDSIVRESAGVIRWGGRAFNDPMHFEISPTATTTAVRRFAVRLLQRRLWAHGYDLGPAGVDGVRGKRTKAATKAFQRAHRLPADAIDGPKTWAILDR